MKVSDLIKKLQEFPQDMIVCVGDWNEGYCWPDEKAAEYIYVTNTRFRNKLGDKQVGEIVLIASD